MPELKLEYAVAVGDGTFPFWMLHEERCFPNCDHSADRMHGDENEGRRVVVLARYEHEPTPWHTFMWAQFGWTLITDVEGRGFARIEDAVTAAEQENQEV